MIIKIVKLNKWARAATWIITLKYFSTLWMGRTAICIAPSLRIELRNHVMLVLFVEMIHLLLLFIYNQYRQQHRHRVIVYSTYIFCCVSLIICQLSIHLSFYPLLIRSNTTTPTPLCCSVRTVYSQLPICLMIGETNNERRRFC